MQSKVWNTLLGKSPMTSVVGLLVDREAMKNVWTHMHVVTDQNILDWHLRKQT